MMFCPIAVEPLKVSSVPFSWQLGNYPETGFEEIAMQAAFAYAEEQSIA
jgi:hypothetical protein